MTEASATAPGAAGFVDLHVHTNCSDGTFTPAEAVRHAKKAGLRAIAITDHDTIDGVEEAVTEGGRCGVEVIAGVELSTEIKLAENSEMHILGYFIDPGNVTLRESLARFRAARRDRAAKMIEKFKKLGIYLDDDRLAAIAGDGCIGRLHFAKALIEGGFVRNIGEAFQQYLGMNKSAYVPKLQMKPDEAINLITSSGGIAVIAHPYYGHYSNRELLLTLIQAGLGGIEVWHSKHPPASVDMFKKMAKDLNLLMTGGSDCHGSFNGDDPLMGSVRVSYQAVSDMKDHLARRAAEPKAASRS